MSQTRSRSVALCVAILALVLTDSWASAGFDFTSASRSVNVQINGYTPGSQTLSSSSLGLFQQTAHVQDAPQPFGFATQSMTSELQPALIYFTGGWSGHYPGFAGTGIATGGASAVVNFSITQDTTVLLSLDAMLKDPDGPNGNRFVKLTGPNTNITFSAVNMLPPEYVNYTGPISRSQSATLTPGAYTLSLGLASYNASAQTRDDWGAVLSYDVRLSIPEPATGACVLIPASILTLRRRRGLFRP